MRSEHAIVNDSLVRQMLYAEKISQSREQR